VIVSTRYARFIRRVLAVVFCFLLPLSVFAAGNMLTVQLNDLYSGQRLANVRITLQQVGPGDALTWVDSLRTDAQAEVHFDVDASERYRVVARPYGGKAVSKPFPGSVGRVRLTVGRLPVMVRSALNGQPLVAAKVTLYRMREDGRREWFARHETDASGLVIFEPDGLDGSTRYRLGALSPADGSRKYSALISATGPFEFIVGNPPVEVAVVNGVSGRPLADLELNVFERLGADERRWVARRTTDENGQALIDLDGLDAGRVYYLSAKPYNAGRVDSSDISRPGKFRFRVGTTPARLLDALTGAAIPAVRLTAYRKTEDGRLHWYRSGETDASGIVHFDLPALGAGEWYQFRAQNPFSQGQRFYSRVTGVQGPFDFMVEPGMPTAVDRQLPTLSILSPRGDLPVADAGFSLSGVADDDRGLAKLEATVSDPLLGTTRLQVSLDASSGRWRASVPASSITSGERVSLRVKAWDSSRNAASAGIDVDVIQDTLEPRIQILAPSNANGLSEKGFLIHGNVGDDTGVDALTVTLRTSDGRTLVDSPPIKLSVAGNWAYWVRDESLSAGESISALIRARDSADNVAETPLDLSIVAASHTPAHWLNRLTFGVSDEMLMDVAAVGMPAWLNRQLFASDSIVDDEADALLRQADQRSKRDLARYVVARAVVTRRQLREVMTWFWDNHFNTDVNKHGRAAYEFREYELFRKHALGRFRDLLEISATSPAMLIYLDNISSRKGNPNENYARELLELHTLGVDGGYSEQDVAEVARAFTGWRVKQHAFFFDAHRHDDDEKIVLGQRIAPGGGIDDGRQVLDLLARHPSTARFICAKLARRFVSDKPGDALVAGCAEVFLDTDGDIAQVLAYLFASPDFVAPESFHAKYKNPAEFIVSMLRALPIVPAGNDLRRALESMAMPLFMNPVPTGWPDSGDKWISSNQSLNRARLAIRIAYSPIRDYRTHMTLKPVVRAAGLDTTDAVVGHFVELLSQGDISTAEIAVLRSLVGENFDPEREDAEAALSRLVSVMLAMPGFQLK